MDTISPGFKSGYCSLYVPNTFMPQNLKSWVGFASFSKTILSPLIPHIVQGVGSVGWGVEHLSSYHLEASIVYGILAHSKVSLVYPTLLPRSVILTGIRDSFSGLVAGDRMKILSISHGFLTIFGFLIVFTIQLTFDADASFVTSAHVMSASLEVSFTPCLIGYQAAFLLGSESVPPY